MRDTSLRNAGRVRKAAPTLIAALALLAAPALADWLAPDPSLKQAQETLARALTDTTQSTTAPRLDSLGRALVRVGRLEDARPVFDRALALSPGDPAASAGLARIALWKDDRLGLAESLLAGVAATDPQARADLFATRLRRGAYAAAADMAEAVDQGGRAPLLRRLAEVRDVCTLVAGPEIERLRMQRAWPTPIVQVKLNGETVLMAVDTGAGDLLLDEGAARRTKVELMPSQTQALWDGTHVAVRNALVQHLALGGMQLERIPAAVLKLHRYSLDVNPQGQDVAGVIGLNLLRLFRPAIDQKHMQLELARVGRAWRPPAGAQEIPFEVWGENELTVHGTVAGGRRLALLFASGLPGCDFGAPASQLEEFGIRPTTVSRAVGGASRRLGGSSWPHVVVPSLAVGPIARDRISGCSGALDAGEQWPGGTRRDGLLGGTFFRGRRVTIDWERHSLVVE